MEDYRRDPADEREERYRDRVAALDIAKASAVVCVRIAPGSLPAAPRQRTLTVPATTNAIRELADQLVCERVELVVMEATGDYWKPFFWVFEAHGLPVQLVNPRDVKNVPGRAKTDRLDAQWLAKLAERGMLRASFVPPKPVRQLRDLTHLRTTLLEERSRHRQRVEKVLEDAQIKLSTVATDIFGVSGRAMLAMLISGQRDPRALADLALGRLASKHTELVEAFTGCFEEHHALILGFELRAHDALTVLIEEVTGQIEQLIRANLPAQARVIERLCEIPGIGERTAQAILAEIGFDMAVFPSPGHLASWAKLTPRTIQSGARATHGPTGKGNRWLKGALGQAAFAASRTKNTYLGTYYRRLVKRMPRKKALTALARKILEIIWHLMSDPRTRYADLGADFYDKRHDPEREMRKAIKTLERQGLTVRREGASITIAAA